MYRFRVLRVLAVLAAVGCNDPGSNKPTAGTGTPTPPPVGSKQTSSAELGKKTEAYWNKCIEVNNQFLTDKRDLWFKEFRRALVGATVRDAAQRLREIDKTGVDPEVIDHVNRVIRGFEQMGAIAETKGRESLWRDAAAAVAFVIKMAKAAPGNAGLVADGGSLAMGIGASEQGGKATSEGQAQTLGIANKLMESEEQVIRSVRKTYGIELKPW